MNFIFIPYFILWSTKDLALRYECWSTRDWAPRYECEVRGIQHHGMSVKYEGFSTTVWIENLGSHMSSPCTCVLYILRSCVLAVCSGIFCLFDRLAPSRRNASARPKVKVRRCVIGGIDLVPLIQYRDPRVSASSHSKIIITCAINTVRLRKFSNDPDVTG